MKNQGATFTEAEVTIDSGEGNNNLFEGNSHTKRQLQGAAAAGGIAGLVIGGPLLAAVAAGGAAYAATSKGDVGESARKSGDAMADFGIKIKRWNREHQVVERTTSELNKAADWATKRLKPRDGH